MITILTSPKAFRGHIGVIQLNAITSWTRLVPRPQVILLGNDEGTAEVARRLAVEHCPDVACSESGAPLVNDLLEKGQQLATYPLVCLINADIILTRDFCSSIQRLSLKGFLLVGQRWDLDVEGSINFDSDSWEANLRARLRSKARLHAKSGIDYFVFPCGFFQDVPPFAIGRTTWDNWLVYKARFLGVPVVDATTEITAIHQNHELPYAGGRAARSGWKEAQQNRQLVSANEHLFTLEDCNYVLTEQGPKKRTWTRHRMQRELDMLAVLRPRYSTWFAFCKRLTFFLPQKS